ncbi:zinc finger protein 41-like isoform X1 [Cydia pomonella]|uniref:zinc finger protein 41-like isoform X1 n=1 Tax=Cydia pomonella TaxID=82600 RepID=UPI002ADD4514|nr:zinc finger protein 41-like isoform X1 [Cydia pomonella]XP_061721158.1 zinc finger protein 41-like isoform X1 [Cydia pomonella]
MPYCYAPGCNHISRRESCYFFRFPADTKLFEEWKTLCPLKDKEPTTEDLLCSCHFINGDKANLPTVFAHSNTSIEDFASSETVVDKATSTDLTDQQKTKTGEWECRACLEKVGPTISLVNLFDPWASPWEGMESTVAEDLAKVGHIKLSSTDQHSKFICSTCYTKLQNACTFAAVVQKSDRILRQRYPQADLDPGDATVWPKPIQLEQNINDTVFENPMDIEIKQEVLSDDDYGENGNGCSDTQYKELADAEIKIEPEEWIKPQPIKINGTFSYHEGTEHSAQPNGNEMLEEFLDAPLKEEPTSEIDSDPVPTDLPLECMLCAKSFHSVSGLKAHVIAQHSYKSVKRKIGGKQSPLKKKDKYVCSTCRRNFVTSTDLMVHETCHNKAICYGCNQKFDSFEQLSRHRVLCKVITTQHLPKPKTLEDVKRIIAEEHKSTDDEDLPKEHLECHLCTERFSDSYYMRIHQEIHHSSEQPEPAAPPPPSPDDGARGMDPATLESIFSEDQ